MASGVELFRLMAKLVMDTSEFDASVASAKKSAEGLGGAFDGAESKVTKLSSALNVMSKVGGAVSNTLKGVIGAGLGLVETSASLDALEQSMASTFAGVEEEAGAALQRVSEDNNIAMLRLQESGLSFFRQFTSSGMDSANALLNMEKALSYAADAAAAYDKSLEDSGSMIRSFIRGNVEAGESIGLFISQVKREEMAMEEYGKEWKELNEAERQFLLLDVVGKTYEQSKVAGQGALERANWSNVGRNLSSAWTKAQAMMGDEIREALIPALQELTKWVQDNPDLFKNLGKVFGDVVKSMVGAFQSLLTFVSEHGDTITAFFDALSRLLSGDLTRGEFLFGESSKKTISREDAIAAMRAYVGDEINYLDLTNKIGKDAAKIFSIDDIGLSGQALEDKILQALSLMQGVLNDNPLTVDVEPRTPWQGAANFLTGLFKGATPHAMGLPYVPYDGYPAILHRGESVLNRVEATDWRSAAKSSNSGQTNTGITRDELLSTLRNMSISMDGRTVGALVTPYVSREQAAEAWRRR